MYGLPDSLSAFKVKRVEKSRNFIPLHSNTKGTNYVGS